MPLLYYKYCRTFESFPLPNFQAAQVASDNRDWELGARWELGALGGGRCTGAADCRPRAAADCTAEPELELQLELDVREVEVEVEVGV
jgi:hypothetical protein